MSKRKSRLAGGMKGPAGGRFYFFTIFYGLWFLVGAFVGFARKGSYLCLGLSGTLGLLMILLGFGHLIEYNRAVPIESIYATIPFFISMAIGSFMTAMYGIGQPFMPSGFVGISCDIATVIYGALIWRDFIRERNFFSRNTYDYVALADPDDARVPKPGSTYDPWLKGSRDPLFT